MSYEIGTAAANFWTQGKNTFFIGFQNLTKDYKKCQSNELSDQKCTQLITIFQNICDYLGSMKISAL